MPHQIGLIGLLCLTGLLLLLSHLASAQLPQAPGDESSSCTLQDLGDNKKVLLDSRHYDNLLQSGGVWDTNNGVWAYRLGGACTRQVRACSESSEAQNNWMFTQHISKALASGETGGYAVNISVEVQYRFSCSSTTVCALGSGAGQMLGVYRYTVDTPQNQKNTALYTLIDTIQDSSILAGRKTTLMFTLSSSEGGFYLGFRDEGTCLQLEKLTVYRYRCPRQENGLVTYPETASPVSGAVSTSAICGAGAESDNPALQCSSDGSWSGSPTCGCSDAFLSSGGACEACGAGKFHSVKDKECKDCPANSMSTEEAVSVCPCSEGYYRNTNDTNNSDEPDDGCTGKPSCVQNLIVSAKGMTFIELQWTKPLDTGGRTDLYYTIQYRDSASVDSKSVTVESQMNTVRANISGLEPASDYLIDVISENGVTDQFDESALCRVMITNTTGDSPPGPPSLVLVADVYIVWQPPSSPNGVITGYDVSIYRRDDVQNANDLSFGATTVLYEFSDEDVPGGGGEPLVRVRAKNSAGEGEWSAEVSLYEAVAPSTTGGSTPDGVSSVDLIIAVVVTLVAATLLSVLVTSLVCCLLLQRMAFFKKGGSINVETQEYELK